MGTLSAADIVGGSYTITDPGVGLENGNTYTQLFLPPSPYTFQFVLTDFTASPTELTLPSGGLFEHFFSGPQNSALDLDRLLEVWKQFRWGNTFYECGNPSSAGFFTSNITGGRVRFHRKRQSVDNRNRCARARACIKRPGGRGGGVFRATRGGRFMRFARNLLHSLRLKLIMTSRQHAGHLTKPMYFVSVH